MDVRRSLILVAAAALVAPLTGAAMMPAAAAALPAAVPASVCFPSTDNGDPVLTAFTIDPLAVDSRKGARVVTFTAAAEDTGGPSAASGVRGGRVQGRLGDWEDHFEVALEPDGKGALTGTLEVLPQARAGTWYVEGVHIEDQDGNLATYSRGDLAEQKLPTSFVTTTDPDTVRPRLQSLRLSSATVDSRRHPSSFTVTVDASDDSAGVASVRVGLVGRAHARPVHASLRLVDGTSARGTWRGRIVVGRWQATGARRLFVELFDAVGNRRVLSGKRLAAQGQPTSVRVLSGEDREAPTVTIRSVTPTTLDLRAGARSVSVEARVRDAGAVRRVVLAMLSSPTGQNSPENRRVRLSRVSGTARDGIWRGTLTLQPCAAPAGTWTGWVSARDGATRQGAAQLPTDVTVVNADVVRPSGQVAGETYAVRRSGPVTVTFDEDVVGIDAANAVVHVGDPQEGRPGDPAPIPGTWSCANAAEAPVDCVTGPVRTAAFTPASPLHGATDHTVVLNPEHHLGVTDLAGNPWDAPWLLGFRTA